MNDIDFRWTELGATEPEPAPEPRVEQCSACGGRGLVVICARCDESQAKWRCVDGTWKWLCDGCIEIPKE